MHENGGKLAQTVFIKMMPGDGSNSMQKYLREVLSKHGTYDELEEEMYRELARREDKKDAGGLNQIDGDNHGDKPNPTEINQNPAEINPNPNQIQIQIKIKSKSDHKILGEKS